MRSRKGQSLRRQGKPRLTVHDGFGQFRIKRADQGDILLEIAERAQNRRWVPWHRGRLSTG